MELNSVTSTVTRGGRFELDPATKELEHLVAHLTIANETNRVIGAAIGILMERYGLEYAVAHQHLLRLSQDSNTKMRLVAAALVSPTTTNLPSARTGGRARRP